jgi:hypothetical protein
MRTLFGIIIGIVITIGGAYLYDSHNALAAESNTGPKPQTLVNWDIAGQKWSVFSDTARVQWDQLSDRARVEWNRHLG